MSKLSTELAITTESLETMGIDKKDMPFLLEALKDAKAKKEAFIIVHQNNYSLFLNDDVKRVFIELERNYSDGSDIVKLMNVFNLGYIMGIRKERARRKAVIK